jgi:hypothetical protein
MIKLRMSIWEIAGLDLTNEGKDPNENLVEVVNKAIKIRKWLDLQEDKKEKTRFKKVI